MRNSICLLILLVSGWCSAAEMNTETCQDVENLTPHSALNSLAVLHSVFSSLGYQVEGGNYNAPPEIQERIFSAKVTITESPKHGSLKELYKSTYWGYVPETGYEGTDRVAFVVDVFGKHYTFIYNLLVHEVVNDSASPAECLSAFPNGKVPTQSNAVHK